ncbi:MAG: hypothetical protein IJ537_09930 [Bacteroidaceae bacterium]|nr:hypothetical protein [Bacteroidaceae bacterium]MBQ9170324.1 hypothetical protein [Bacteroidaceae bacterium]
MKNLALSGLLTLLFASCYFDTDLNDYDSIVTPNKSMSEEYYWLYNSKLFHGIDSCQVVGQLENENDEQDFYSINRKCLVSNDTIYVAKRDLTGNHTVLNGRFYIDDEQYEVYEKLR